MGDVGIGLPGGDGFGFDPCFHLGDGLHGGLHLVAVLQVHLVPGRGEADRLGDDRRVRLRVVPVRGRGVLGHQLIRRVVAAAVVERELVVQPLQALDHGVELLEGRLTGDAQVARIVVRVPDGLLECVRDDLGGLLADSGHGVGDALGDGLSLGGLGLDQHRRQHLAGCLADDGPALGRVDGRSARRLPGQGQSGHRPRGYGDGRLGGLDGRLGRRELLRGLASAGRTE